MLRGTVTLNAIQWGVKGEGMSKIFWRRESNQWNRLCLQGQKETQIEVSKTAVRHDQGKSWGVK